MYAYSSHQAAGLLSPFLEYSHQTASRPAAASPRRPAAVQSRCLSRILAVYGPHTCSELTILLAEVRNDLLWDLEMPKGNIEKSLFISYC